MIDLHCHILPGLDDGPQEIEESLAMSKIAIEDGIKTIVATPHTLNGMFINDREAILTKVKGLQSTFKQEGIDIQLVPGADVHVNYNILTLIKEGKALTINNQGHYLLLEFPHQFVPPNIIKQIFELKLKGITPIITHPERNTAIQNNLNLIFPLVEHGALIQITSMSITGGFGPKAYRCSVEMLKSNLAHIIASDAHCSHIRLPLLSNAVKKASKIVGQDYAQAMVTKIPQAIITGAIIPDLPDPKRFKKSYFLKNFFKFY